VSIVAFLFSVATNPGPGQLSGRESWWTVPLLGGVPAGRGGL